MKEIDFLPGWYKNDRRQQITFRAQYVALAGIFVLMLVSNFTTSRSISKAQAQLNGVQSMEAASKDILAEYAKVTGEVAALKKKSDVLDQIDSKLVVGDVLAELSFLTGQRIVLTRVEFVAGKFTSQQSSGSGGGYAVRPAGLSSSGKEELFLSDVRYKVVLGGIAAESSEVGRFICSLEDSPYFCSVYPSFTRNRHIKLATGSTGRISSGQGENLQVSEFEICCYLANFIEN